MAQGFFVLDAGTGVRDLSGIVFSDGGTAPARVSLTELEAAAARVRAAKQ
jgi:hypothetical protein